MSHASDPPRRLGSDNTGEDILNRTVCAAGSFCSPPQLMAEWRFLRGWWQWQLRARLDPLSTAPLHVDAVEQDMTPRHATGGATGPPSR